LAAARRSASERKIGRGILSCHVVAVEGNM